MAARFARILAGAFCPDAAPCAPVPVTAGPHPRSIRFVFRNDSLGVR